MDVAILTVVGGGLEVALVRRSGHPHKGCWALPGGLVRMDESLDRAAEQVLGDKAGLRDVYLEQLYSFGDPERDPRTRVISLAYYALADHARLARHPAGDRTLAFGRIAVPWEGETGGPVEARDAEGGEMPLAFDHADILGMAVKRIRGKLDLHVAASDPSPVAGLPLGSLRIAPSRRGILARGGGRAEL